MRSVILAFSVLAAVVVTMWIAGIAVESFLKRRKAQRRQAAAASVAAVRWDVYTDVIVDKNTVFVDVSRKQDDRPVPLERQLVGAVALDHPDFDNELFDLRTRAYARAIRLNSLMEGQ